ncbi:MAG TPA: glycosyltransferase family A protein [Chitinophagaceae bacterium]|nr:glycosyltransferase family A protein [Chitinophagaceae bacterium]
MTFPRLLRYLSAQNPEPVFDLYAAANPQVSVIMATYDRGAYLHRSIDSFLRQTYRDAELIVVDDGSHDDTFLLVKAYQEQHPGIRYLRHTNRKAPLTKNAGIQAAVGRYLAFLDSDDEYKPDYLQVRMEYMLAHPQTDLIEGGAIIIGDEWVKDKNDLSRRIHLSCCHIGATFFGKAHVFNILGGFDKHIRYSEDGSFWERAERQFTVEKIDHPGYVYYRDTPGSVCNEV